MFSQTLYIMKAIQGVSLMTFSPKFGLGFSRLAVRDWWSVVGVGVLGGWGVGGARRARVVSLSRDLCYPVLNIEARDSPA
jgi:hypothetical protein